MKKRKVRVTNTGYLPNSPDRNNPMNIIPSNQITMKNVPFPIMGIDNLGNQQMMMPGMNYTFPGQYVTEIPMGKYQKGGLVKYQNKGQVNPKSKGWREYKTPTGESLYLDPRFKDQRYYVNEKGDHVTPNQNMSLYDVTDNIWESGTSLPPLEVSPKYKYVQRPGALGAMETIRMDLDNGSQEVTSPDVMATKREMDAFTNSFNPAGLLVTGAGNIAQGNIGQGLMETALSIPIVGQTIGKVVTAPLKFAGREVASTYGPALSEIGNQLGISAPLKNVYSKLNTWAFKPKEEMMPTGIGPSTVEKPVLDAYSRSLRSMEPDKAIGKLVDKSGNISINNIQAQLSTNNLSNIEKEILSDVLSKHFVDKKTIPFSDLQQAVHESIVPLQSENIVSPWDNMGLGAIGYVRPKKINIQKAIDNGRKELELIYAKGEAHVNKPEVQEVIKDIEKTIVENESMLANAPESSTILFHNQKEFGPGSNQHFDDKTLGHTRYFVTKEEPDVWHTLESQSDYAQGHHELGRASKKIKSLEEALEKQKEAVASNEELLKANPTMSNPDDPWYDFYKSTYLFDKNVLKEIETNLAYRKSLYGDIERNFKNVPNFSQKEVFRVKNQDRLFQENLKQAHERGFKKMRYPTAETAAKIQGYTKGEPSTEFINSQTKLRNDIVEALEKHGENSIEFKALNDKYNKLLKDNALGDYSPEHQTILKKYLDAPKMIKKLIGQDVKTITDSKGNTWYEIEIPEKVGINIYRNGGMYLGKYEFRDGGLVKIENDLDTYAYGGKVVSEIWTEKTGLPWSAAKKLGLSDGSYDRNIQLRKELIRGEHINLNKNPQVISKPRVNQVQKQIAKPIQQITAPSTPQVSRRPQSVGKPLSTQYGAYNWSKALEQNTQQTSQENKAQQTFDNQFKLTNKGTLPELPQEEPFKYPTFAEFQKQKLNNVLTATQPRSKSKVLPTENKRGGLTEKDQAYYDLLNSTKIEYNADAESTARTFNNIQSLDSLEKNKKVQDLILQDAIIESQKSTLRPSTSTTSDSSGSFEFPSATDILKKFLPVSARPFATDEGREYLSQKLKDYVQMGQTFLEKQGLKDPSVEGNLVTFEQPKPVLPVKQEPTDIKQPKNYFIPPTQTAQDNNADYGDPQNEFWGYRYQNSNDSGLVYVPAPRRGVINQKGIKKFDNVKGVAHFLIQKDPVDNWISTGKGSSKEKLDSDLKHGKNYIPFSKKEKDGKVRLKYAKGKEEQKQLEKEGYEPFTTLRNLKLSNIDWNKTRHPISGGYGKGISNVVTKDGKDTHLLFKDASGKGNKLGKYNGTSVVFIIETPEGRIIRDFAGTVQAIEDESKSILKEFKVPADKVTLGFYDSGSHAARPKANKNNEVYYKQYSGFSNESAAAGALMIPADNNFKEGGQSNNQSIYLGNYEFKNGGLVKAQKGLNKRMVRQYPGMKSVYGDRGENLNIIKDKNFIPSEYGYGDIEFIYPGSGLVTYNDEYAYQSPTPDKYTAVYNPKGANKHDVFLDMMHGMRHDPDYMELLNEFSQATRNARGADMDYFFDQDAQQDPNFVIDGREQWDNNYIDGMVRAHIYKKASQQKRLPFVNPFGSKPHGTEDYEMELEPNSPEMYQAADQIYNYIKGDKNRSLKKVKIKSLPRNTR